MRWRDDFDDSDHSFNHSAIKYNEPWRAHQTKTPNYSIYNRNLLLDLDYYCLQFEKIKNQILKLKALTKFLDTWVFFYLFLILSEKRERASERERKIYTHSMWYLLYMNTNKNDFKSRPETIFHKNPCLLN